MKQKNFLIIDIKQIFFDLRLNKDTSATDRKFAIMFGLPSNLIELEKIILVNF